MATKKQHYVWRGYLKRWTDDGTSVGKIWVKRKKKYGNQLLDEYVSVIKVGFENYFYDMSGFTDKDIDIVNQLINHMQESSLIKMGIDFSLLEDARLNRDFCEMIMCNYENPRVPE